MRSSHSWSKMTREEKDQVLEYRKQLYAKYRSNPNLYIDSMQHGKVEGYKRGCRDECCKSASRKARAASRAAAKLRKSSS
jgi:hypothetical protein